MTHDRGPSAATIISGHGASATSPTAPSRSCRRHSGALTSPVGPPVSLEDLNDYCRNFMDNRYEETMIQRGVCVYKLLKSATNGRKSHGWAMLFWDQVDLPGTTEGILDWKRSIVASVSLAHNLKLTELYRDFLDPEVPYSLKSFASGMWEPSVRQGSLAYYVLLLPELEEGRLPSKEDEKRLLQQLRSSGLVLREVQGCDGPGGLHRRRGHWVGLR